MILALLLSLSLGQMTLFDEGVQLGPVKRINCVGAGVVCTLAATGSSTGVLTVAGGGPGGGAPTTAPFITFEATADLSAERVLANGTNTTIDQATPGQVKVNFSGTIGDSSISALATSKLTGTVTNAQLASSYSGIGSCPAGQYVTRTNANAAPTCEAPAGGSGNYVEATVTMVDGMGQATVAAAWVGASSRITCTPVLDPGTTDVNPDVVQMAMLTYATGTRVVATSFDLRAVSATGANGDFKFSCTGN